MEDWKKVLLQQIREDIDQLGLDQGDAMHAWEWGVRHVKKIEDPTTDLEEAFGEEWSCL